MHQIMSACRKGIYFDFVCHTKFEMLGLFYYVCPILDVWIIVVYLMGDFYLAGFRQFVDCSPNNTHFTGFVLQIEMAIFIEA